MAVHRIDAVELHGALAGWLAGGGRDDAHWLAAVMADDTLAPEAATPRQIAALAGAGAVVSLGHTDCDYDTAQAALAAGARAIKAGEADLARIEAAFTAASTAASVASASSSSGSGSGR